MNKRILTAVCAALAVFLLFAPAAVAAIGSETTTFSVSSSPSGATAVFQSSGDRITTPGSFTIHGGTQAWGQPTFITITKSGYETYYYTVYASDFEDGTTYYIDASLTPIYQDGYLSLSSSPSAASAYVDGSYVGTTPLEIPVSEGYHSVSIQKSGYSSWSGSATVTAGQTTYLSGTLTPVQTYGYLSVSSNPSYADVYINGAYMGETPTTLTLSAGSYSVEVKKSGYTSYTTTTYVDSGSTASVYAALASNPGSGYVNIATFPSGAAVYIDGTYVGYTQYSSSQSNPNYLAAGPFSSGSAHTLVLKLDNYQTYTTSFVVSSGEVKSFIVTLSPDTPVPGTASLYLTSTPSNADVYIDNQYYGTTPFYNAGIQAGTHTIRVAASGYTDWTQTSSFTAGQTVELNAVLSQGVNPTVPVPTKTPAPAAGLLAGLGCAAVLFAGRKH
ncbi:MAG: PEGA domain-containing protein [Methanocorpusculum sp.]|nr:PEGA domain-containing protein [Methanocorpusculum sp.]